MSTGMIIFVVVLALFVGYAVVIYNRMVAFRNRVKNGFAQIDVQLQRRYELIPNLVDTAKRYLAHERDTLTEVIEARNQAKAAEESAARQPENAEAMRQLCAMFGLPAEEREETERIGAQTFCTNRCIMQPANEAPEDWQTLTEIRIKEGPLCDPCLQELTEFFAEVEAEHAEQA